MPTIFYYGPDLDKDKKRELVRTFTKAASDATGINESAFVVYLRPTTPDTVAVGGELLEDRRKKS